MKSDNVQSVIRAFDIIEALQRGPMGLIELSKQVSLNKSTAHRLVNTLLYKGYVIQDETTSQYRLSLRFLEIGNQAVKDMDIVDMIKPYIESLAASTHEVIHLVLIEDLDIVYIDKIESSSAIRMHSYIGKRTPLYSSAVGKARMAQLDKEEFDALWLSLAPMLSKLTDHTIINKGLMEKEISTIKQRGYAVDNEENEEGVVCVAATIPSPNHRSHYAISISTPKMRIDDSKMATFGHLVCQTANAISNNLGHLI